MTYCIQCKDCPGYLFHLVSEPETQPSLYSASQLQDCKLSIPYCSRMQLSWRVIIMSANIMSAALDYSTNIDVLRMAIINRVQWSKVHSPSWRWSSQNSPSPLTIGGSTAGGIGISDMPQLVESGQFGKGKTELLTNLLLLVRKLWKLRQFRVPLDAIVPVVLSMQGFLYCWETLEIWLDYGAKCQE